MVVREEKTPSPVVYERYIKKKVPQVIIKEIHVEDPAPPIIKYVQKNLDKHHQQILTTERHSHEKVAEKNKTSKKIYTKHHEEPLEPQPFKEKYIEKLPKSRSTAEKRTTEEAKNVSPEFVYNNASEQKKSSRPRVNSKSNVPNTHRQYEPIYAKPEKITYSDPISYLQNTTNNKPNYK